VCSIFLSFWINNAHKTNPHRSIRVLNKSHFSLYTLAPSCSRRNHILKVTYPLNKSRRDPVVFTRCVLFCFSAGRGLAELERLLSARSSLVCRRQNVLAHVRVRPFERLPQPTVPRWRRAPLFALTIINHGEREFIRIYVYIYFFLMCSFDSAKFFLGHRSLSLILFIEFIPLYMVSSASALQWYVDT
jgi:hypothetical protein